MPTGANNQMAMDFSMPMPTGDEMRDRGITKAVEHADALYGTWSDQAFDFFMKYLQTAKEFMAEDVRTAANGKVPPPPSLRAWGGVIVRACKAGLIKRIGFRNVTNIKAHSTPAAVWQKC